MTVLELADVPFISNQSTWEFMKPCESSLDESIFGVRELMSLALRFERAYAASLRCPDSRASGELDVEGQELDFLAATIRETLAAEAGLDPIILSAAYFALGKRCDPADVPFLRDRLKVELNRDPQVLFQVMIALENMGEDVFSPERDSYSILDAELNRSDAIRYLG